MLPTPSHIVQGEEAESEDFEPIRMFTAYPAADHPIPQES